MTGAPATWSKHALNRAVARGVSRVEAEEALSKVHVPTGFPDGQRIKLKGPWGGIVCAWCTDSWTIVTALPVRG